jgi:hypothetical protein
LLGLIKGARGYHFVRLDKSHEVSHMLSLGEEAKVLDQKDERRYVLLKDS